MKKLLLTIAALIVSAACFNANAEGIIVKGGFNYTHLDLTQSIKDQAQALAVGARNFSGFHAGIGYQTEELAGFTLQPEFRFLSNKGNAFGEGNTWSLNYLELPINVQWGIDLVALRPFVQLSPYIGYNIRNTLRESKSTSEPAKQFLKNITTDPGRFSYGLGIGGGIELMRKFQITAQYVWNFGQVVNAQQYIDHATNVSRDTAAGLEISIALMF